MRVANSGARALKVAASAPIPDLILLDVMMPDLDGYEVIKHLKADPQTHDIPVIFVTALSANEDEHRGLALGAVDYIGKPVNPATVLARVRTHLELKQARDRMRDENVRLEAEVERRGGRWPARCSRPSACR
ncbi:response regulator [Thiocapsa rosea]|uniref:response regulator n=1 Tax=Thiocapsa rosea TaxID=69360 RepID=UPI001FE92CAD|nr:response regulator [Thiocapsa rosea]